MKVVEQVERLVERLGTELRRERELLLVEVLLPHLDQLRAGVTHGGGLALGFELGEPLLEHRDLRVFGGLRRFFGLGRTGLGLHDGVDDVLVGEPGALEERHRVARRDRTLERDGVDDATELFEGLEPGLLGLERLLGGLALGTELGLSLGELLEPVLGGLGRLLFLLRLGGLGLFLLRLDLGRG